MDRKEESLKTLTAFREATMELDNVYSLFSKSCGLSEAEYWSLLLIYEGAVTQSQTLNSAFKQLRKNGLVRLEPYEENQRSKQAFLTEAGKEFVEKNVLRMHRVEEKAWQQISEQEREILTKSIRKLCDLIRTELDI